MISYHKGLLFTTLPEVLRLTMQAGLPEVLRLTMQADLPSILPEVMQESFLDASLNL